MEYHCSKAADVAGRIFERGMESFPDETELALRYLGFLISVNDDASTCHDNSAFQAISNESARGAGFV